MENDEIGNDLVRLDNGYLVDEENNIRCEYVVNSDDVLDEENNSDSGGKNAPLREQDRFLPIANIAKIMKRAIPENGKMTRSRLASSQCFTRSVITFGGQSSSSPGMYTEARTMSGASPSVWSLTAVWSLEQNSIAKDARECVQECISEFISFVTSEASDRCQVEKRKTINGEDVLFAMNALGFDNYVEPLKLYLKKYREIVLSPVTMNKLNKPIIVYGEDGTACIPAENDNDTQTDSAVLYPYKELKVIEDFTIA